MEFISDLSERASVDGYGQRIQVPRTRYHANARERDRTQNVNTAFIVLRAMIPTEPMDRKLSKIETIRLATKYISHLAAILFTGAVLNPCAIAEENRNEDGPRTSLCTFCISESKKYMKSFNGLGINPNFGTIVFSTEPSPMMNKS